MHKTLPSEISLSLSGDLAFLPLAVSFAENAGQAYGFGETELYSLRLCAEEVFTFLCRVLGTAEPVEIRARNGVYRLTLRFLFKPRSLDLRVLNITAKAPLDKGQDLDELGLFVAARMVDQLKLSSEADGRTCLSLAIDRVYCEKTKPCPDLISIAANWQIHPANAGEIQSFAALVKAHYSVVHYPGFLNFPGKAADLVASGDIKAAMAVTDSGAICGGILWTWLSDKMIELFGPFQFPNTQPPALAGALIDHLVEASAKTAAVGIICRKEADQEIPAGFDLLGHTLCHAHRRTSATQSLAIRLLREDEGTAVCCHPSLETFLRKEYDRLVLPRVLRMIPCPGSGSPEHSVLACEIQKDRHVVMLTGLCYGRDATINLREHVSLFADQNLQTILFGLDLGVSWQSAFVPDLIETGFVPRMVIPYAGRSDMVMFQKQ
ncbi:MAG TPA: hypothetical protein P5186_11675 [Candidatus Paceibacterota bacterium]|nr:hypothetical protein [Verrucomicrobiota bacterium]HRY48699.1 hypothetical protein [Candidatus Paceibacterota bacterium]HSA01395.1 hypothetical protein [Candidatus Paceibacterota bacterium]